MTELTSCVSFPLTKGLFADDFSISLLTFNPQRPARLLQSTLDKITKWSPERGFSFSDDKKKTIMVIFPEKILTPYAPSFSASTELRNYHSTLRQVSRSHLRLQILLDLPAPHMKILRAKGLNALNILKYSSHPAPAVPANSSSNHTIA